MEKLSYDEYQFGALVIVLVIGYVIILLIRRYTEEKNESKRGWKSIWKKDQRKYWNGVKDDTYKHIEKPHIDRYQ